MQNTVSAPRRTQKTFEKTHQPKILIAEVADWFSSSEIPFLFNSAGCSVDVFCDKTSWLLKNSYYDNHFNRSPTDKNFERNLTELVKNSDYDLVVLADDDLLFRMNNYLSFENEDLAEKILPLTNLEHRDILGSKAGLVRLCSIYDLISPESYVCNSYKEMNEQVNCIGYPLLLKENRGYGGGGVHLCHNKNEVDKAYDKIENKNNVVVQKYIRGKVIFVEALYKNGELLMYNYSERLKCVKNDFSVSSIRKFYTNRSIESELIKLGKSLGINGFGNLSYILNPETDLHYLFEVDLRPNSWMAYGRFTGADFSLAIKKFFDSNLTLAPNPQPKTNDKPIEVALFFMEMRRCFLNGDSKSLFKWLINYNGYWKYIPIYDKRLFTDQLKKVLRGFGGFLLPAPIKMRLKKFNDMVIFVKTKKYG